MQHDKEQVVEAKFRELERETSGATSSSSSFSQTLKNNTDLLSHRAEYYYQSGEYQKCFELTSTYELCSKFWPILNLIFVGFCITLAHAFFRVLERDPFHLKCTLVHLASAMELGRSNDLYLMAYNLVKDYPQKLVYVCKFVSFKISFN